MKTLSGITWDHTRGYLPMIASAQRFHEIHPEIEIRWMKRSLQAFGDYPVEKLAETFDLLVIDHPFVGQAAADSILLPLEEYIPSSFLDEQAGNSVGQSHASYSFGGHQWALAIDAAAPVSARRIDLLETAPQSWAELIELANRGLVAVPAIPVDSLMNFYMLCLRQGEEPFMKKDRVVSEQTGVCALVQLRELVAACAPECLQRNPIATYETMTRGDDVAYCPFAYGYSNYARPGYARRSLHFGGLVDGLRSTLGGTGLAVSANCRHKQEAVNYAQFVASPEFQRTVYVQSGGQPGHRIAWNDPEANRMTNNCFHQTLATLDNAYLRPRFNGYLHFQDKAGPVVHDYLSGGSNPQKTLKRLDQIYRKSYEAA